MEMVCPHLTVHRKKPVKGDIGPDNSGFPYGIDDLWAFATDAGLYSLICKCWELCPGLEMAHIHGNEDTPGTIMRFHVTLAAESTRLLLPFVFLSK